MRHHVRGLDTHSFRRCPTGQASGGQRAKKNNTGPSALPTRVTPGPGAFAKREIARPLYLPP